MVEHFLTYPYFWSTILMLCVWGGCMLFVFDHRWQILLASLLSTPWATASLMFVPEYWRPVSIVGFLPCIEDILFSFAMGGISWGVAARLLRNRFRYRFAVPHALIRYLAHCTAILVVVLPLHALGASPMVAFVVAGSVLIALLWRRFERSHQFALAGIAGFSLPYIISSLVVFSIWPGFLGQWNMSQLAGFTLSGMPLEEIAWGVGFGASWPVMMADILNATPKKAHAINPDRFETATTA